MVICHRYVALFAGGKPKNFAVIANAGSEVMSRCTLFRNVSDFLVMLHVRCTAGLIYVICLPWSAISLTGNLWICMLHVQFLVPS